MLAILVATAKEDGQVEGLIPHLVEGGSEGYLSSNTLMTQSDLQNGMLYLGLRIKGLGVEVLDIKNKCLLSK